MLAKVIKLSNERGGKVSVQSVMDYLTRDEPEKTGPAQDLTDYVARDRDGLPRNQYLEGGTFNLEGLNVSDPADRDLAVKMMDYISQAGQQKTHFNTNPIYHFALSWRDTEQPDQKQVREAVAHALKSLGMEENQAFFVMHRDKEHHHHVHVIANRVHPEKLTLNGPPRFDYLVLDKACRELEVQQGWQHDNGPHAVIDGEIKRLTKAQRKLLGLAPPEKEGYAPTPAARMYEVHAGAASFAAWAQINIAPELSVVLAQRDASWEQLHEALEKRGVHMEMRGGGLSLVTHALDRETSTKASGVDYKLSLGRLQKVLGPYRPAGISTDDVTPNPLFKEIQHDYSVISQPYYSGAGPAEPPKTIDTVRGLSSRSLDSVQRESEVLLHNDALDRLGKGKAPTDPGVRRSAGSNRATGSRGSAPRLLDKSYSRYIEDVMAGSEPGENPGKTGGNNTTRDQRRMERQSARESLVERFKEEKALSKSKSKDTRSTLQGRHAHDKDKLRQELKASKSARIAELVAQTGSRQIANGIWAAEKAIAIQNQQAAHKLEKAELSKMNNMDWPAWLERQAEVGDEAAMAALRGIRYREQRTKAKIRPGFEGEDLNNTITSPLRGGAIAGEVGPFRLSNADIEIDHQRQRITYKDADGKARLIDTGPRIDVVDREDKDAVHEGLTLASQKFGGELYITGDQEFREKAAREAVRMNIRVADEDLQYVVQQEKSVIREQHGKDFER